MPDKQIVITIPEARVQDFLQAFLRAVPNNERDAGGNLIYTNARWPKVWIVRMLRGAYAKGKQLEVLEANPSDPGGAVNEE